MSAVKLSILVQSLVYFFSMLFSVDFEKLVALELGVDISNFVLLLDLFSMDVLIFDDDILIFPGPPDFILYFFLLPGYLFNSADNTSFPSGDLNHLVSFLLFHYHFASSFFPLVPPFLSLSCPQTTLLPDVISGS